MNEWTSHYKQLWSNLKEELSQLESKEAAVDMLEFTVDQIKTGRFQA